MDEADAQATRVSATATSRGARGTTSRRITSRWRGVVDSQRLGQTGSQKPHSTQRSTSSSTVGVVFRWETWVTVTIRMGGGPTGT